MFRKYYILLIVLVLALRTFGQSSKDSLEFANFYYDALRYIAIENKEMAVQNLERCSELISKESSSLYLRGKILAEQGKLEEAEKLLKKAHQLSPKNFWYVQTLARVFIKLGQKEKAFALYEKQLEADSNNPELYLATAQMLEGNNEFEKAVDYYDKYCAIVGYDQKYLLKIVKLYYQLENFDTALLRLEEIIAKEPNNAQLLILRVDLLVKLKRFEEAKEMFMTMRKRFPDIPDIRLSYAEFLLRTDDHQGLTEQLPVVFGDATVGVSKKLELLKEVLSNQKLLFNDTTVENFVEKLVEVHPNSYDINFLAGSFWFDMTKFPLASTHLQKARQLQPNHVKVWIMELNALASYGATARENEVADSALLLYPTYPEVYLFKGHALMRNKTYDEAIEMLDTGMELIVEDSNLVIDFKNVKAELFYSKKNYNSAFDLYEEVIAYNPENEVIINNYAYFAAEQSSRLKRVEKLMEVLVEKSPNNHKYLDTYAWVLYKKKETDKALIFIRKSISNGGIASAMVQEHYGDILREKKMVTEAKAAYLRALELDKDNEKIKAKLKRLENE